MLVVRGAQAKLLDRYAANQMFLNDPLKHCLSARMIPDTIGPDDGNRPCSANLQAIGLAALDTAGPRQPELLKAALKVLPGSLTGLATATFLLFGHGAEEDVATDRISANLGKRPLGFRPFPVSFGSTFRAGRGNGQPFLPAIREISA